MAARLQAATLFRISRSLFRDSNGAPISFYTEYNSDDLHSIIHKGGGSLVDNTAEADIVLCEKRTDNKVNEGHLPLDFIVECVMKNHFINLDTYRTEYLGLKASTSKDDTSASDSSEDEKNMVKFSGNSRISIKAAGLSGRKKYSDIEDYKIITYLINHDKYSETGGNIVWKQMALVKVTDHTHQSMKARFQKKILPEIDKYNIPLDWKAKLCGDYVDDSPDHDIGLDAFDDFDALKSDKRFKTCGDTKITESAAEVKSNSSVKSAPISKDLAVNTSEKESVTPSLHDQHSPTVIMSSVTETNSSVLVLTESLFNETQLAQVQNMQTDICEADDSRTNALEKRVDIPVDTSFEQNEFYPDIVGAETQSFDEMDYLIISEANKNKKVGFDTDKNSNQSSISNVEYVTRKRTKEMSSCVLDECSPIKMRNISTNSQGHKGEMEIQRENIVGDNSHDKLINNSSAFQNKSIVNHSQVNRQHANLDEQDDEVSKKYRKSLSKIFNIVEKGASDYKTRIRSSTSKNSESELRHFESDTLHKLKLTHEKEVSKTCEISSACSNIKAIDVQPMEVTRELNVFYIDNPERSCENSSLASNTESLRIDRSSGCRLQSISAGQVRKQKSVKHLNTLGKFFDISDEEPSSSKINTKTVCSKDSSSDISSKESDFPYKRKGTKKQASITQPAPKVSTVDKTETKIYKRATSSKDSSSDKSNEESDFPQNQKGTKKQTSTMQSAPKDSAIDRSEVNLASENQEAPSLSDVQWKLCSREATIRRVKFVSEEYGLSIYEAANLLLIHNGSLISLMQYFDS